MDEINEKILELLIEDGRRSYAEIAAHLNLSGVAVRERIKNMKETGIIEKFTVVVSGERVGKGVSAFFIIDCDPNYLVKVAKSLVDLPDVASCYQMTGPTTLHAHVLVKDFLDLERFINEELYSLPGISSVESHVLLRRFKSRAGLKI